MAKGNGSGLTDGDTANEDGGVVTFELALEQTVEFGILGGLLAVLHALRGGRVAGLLSENLGKFDDIGIVLEGLGEVDHIVGSVLLIASLCSGKEGCEGVDGD